MLTTLGLLTVASAQTHVHSYGADRILGALSTPSGDHVVAELYPDRYAAIGRTVTFHWYKPAHLGEPLQFADVNGDGVGDSIHYDPTTDDLVAIDPTSGLEALRLTLPLPRGVTDVLFHDVDGDGLPEITGRICPLGELCVMDGQGQVLWTAPTSARSAGFAFVQTDSDPELELAIGREAYDALDGALLGTLPGVPAGAYPVAAGDVDGDGPDDLIYLLSGDRVAVDVRTGATWWTLDDRFYVGPRPELADLNGDGLDDVVWSRPLQTRHGATAVPIDLLPRRCGGTATPVALDPGGAAFAACNDIPVLTDVHGEVVDFRGIRSVTELAAVELIGGGEPEIVALGERVTVFDAGGAKLSTEVFPEGVIDVLRYPSGHAVLVRSDAGLVQLRWSGGLVRGRTLVPTSQPLDDPHVIDGDGDGDLDLVYREGSWQLLDVITGGISSTGVSGAFDTLAELDGTPGVDGLLGITPGTYTYQTSNGDAGTLFGHNLQLVETPTGAMVLLTNVGEARLFDLSVANWTPAMTLALPIDAGGVWYAEGRLWYQRGDAIVAHALDGGPEWTFPTPAILKAPPVLTATAVWFATDIELQRWDHP